MLSVYVGKLLPRYQCLDFLFPNLGAPIQTNDFGEPYPFSNTAPVLKTVDSPYEADMCLYPYSYSVAKREPDHFRTFLESIELSRKPLMIAALGDEEHDVLKEATYVLRTSAYKKELSKRDIVVPPTVADLGALYGVLPKKKDDVPTVGFCGFAGFPNIRTQFRFEVKNAIDGIFSIFSERVAVRRRGIHFRRKTMAALHGSHRVRTRFIIRPFYSGSRKTIGMDREMARREYVENMQNADFVLAPKGDGNYSLRFYEALSLGRVPILIDTDMPLPGEASWYDGAIVRVSWRDIGKLPEIIAEQYESLGDETFSAMEGKARALFSEHLYAPHFYRNLFDGIPHEANLSRGL